MKKIFLVSILGLVIFTSCKKDEIEIKSEDNQNVVEYKLMHTDTISDDRVVSLYAESNVVYNEYTHLFVKIKDFNGKEIKDLALEFRPIMDMGSMQHACPVIQPTYKTSTKMYHGISMFTMAGEWDFVVAVAGEEVHIPITVQPVSSGLKYIGSYSGTDGQKYIVSLVKPVKWKQGMNDFSIMVHRKQSDISFPPVDDFEVVLNPQMTSMGHGSPNNVSPVSTGNGSYKGNVNFTMTGDWRLNLDLVKNNDTIVNAYLDIKF